ncbi:MAG: 5-oxoprolinase subunit PxpA [Pseudomonadota bacterium]
MANLIVDLNTDCGESYGPWPMGNDAALMKVVTSANIACGFHAGDPDTMAVTMGLAVQNGVAIGAHPGFDDKQGFGRRVIPMAPDAITRMVAYQVGAAAASAALAGGTLTYVKAHGALSNHASGDADAAAAVAAAVKAVDPNLTLLAIATTELERAGKAAGLKVAAEIFADRHYEPDGMLVSRAKPNAMVEDPEEAATRMVEMVTEGVILANDGSRIKTDVHSICVHGDGPTAVPLATRVREALEAAGVTIAPFAPAQ